MTFHPWHVGLALWLFLVIWRILAATRRGVWPAGKLRYRRDDQPIEYWFSAFFEVGLAAALLWWAYRLARSEPSSAALPPFLLLIGIYAAFRLVRSLQLDSTTFWGGVFERREEPAGFWILAIVQVTVAAGSFWLALFWVPPAASDQGSEVYAVTKAVREQIPGGQNAAFSNVRLDARSGYVCGELTLKGSRRRFFGNERHGEASAVLEDRSSGDFERAYHTDCGGEWVLPQAG